MTLVFLGSGPFGLPALEMLARSAYRPALVVTRPDRPGGRGQKPTPTPIHVRSRELELPVEAPASANDPAFLERLRAAGTELMIVADYGEMLRAPLREVPRMGIFNLHASLLPRHRGAAPVVAALLAGDAETGVTLFRIVKGLDQGPVVAKASTAILPMETAGALEERLARLAADLLERTLPGLESASLPETPQDDGLATLAPKLPKGAGEIDWSRPAREIANYIRALSPKPGAYTFLPRKGGAEPVRVKVLLAREGAINPASPPPQPPPPGSVASVEKHGFQVCAGGGVLDILSIQPAGRAVLTASEFLRGYPLSAGDRFAGSGGQAAAGADAPA